VLGGFQNRLRNGGSGFAVILDRIVTDSQHAA
jgi:hypothetical protein